MPPGRCEQKKKLWASATEFPRSAGRPFYERLNGILEDAVFDRFATQSEAVRRDVIAD